MLGIALMLASLCEPDAALGLVFGISVSTAIFLSNIFFRSTLSHTTLSVRMASTIIISSCMAVALSRLLGAMLSGDADGTFYAVTGAAGAAACAFFGKSDDKLIDTLLTCAVLIPSSFTVGALREMIGDGTVFGYELMFTNGFKVGSLRSYFGGLLISSAVASVIFAFKGRWEGKDGA